jgi:outer membrane translocation and assembly module TamA
VIVGEVFGRELVFGTLEYEHPLSTRFGAVGVAGFVDAARAARRLVPGSSPFHVDVGGGVRFSASGTGTVRLDLGYGVRDSDIELSAGYVVPWGRR